MKKILSLVLALALVLACCVLTGGTAKEFVIVGLVKCVIVGLDPTIYKRQ